MKLVSLSPLRNGRLYAPGNNLGTHFCQRLNRTEGDSAAGRIMSMKHRTRNLPDGSAAPRPTAPQSAPFSLPFINLEIFTWQAKGLLDVQFALSGLCPSRPCFVSTAKSHRLHFHECSMVRDLSLQLSSGQTNPLELRIWCWRESLAYYELPEGSRIIPSLLFRFYTPFLLSFLIWPLSKYTVDVKGYYPLSYGVPVRERYGSTLLPATREQHDQNCTQSH